jgi:hypothetical protein
MPRLECRHGSRGENTPENCAIRAAATEDHVWHVNFLKLGRLQASLSRQLYSIAEDVPPPTLVTSSSCECPFFG